MTTNELILDMLERMERKLDQLDRKMDMKHTELAEKVDARFESLTCQDQNLRIDRLEQQEFQRQGNKGLIWAGVFTALSAFGLSLWQWIKGQ